MQLAEREQEGREPPACLCSDRELHTSYVLLLLTFLATPCFERPSAKVGAMMLDALLISPACSVRKSCSCVLYCPQAFTAILSYK